MDSNNIPLYLATPIGELKLYTPNSGNTSGKVISDQLVVDPKYTAYNQIKNTLIWGGWISSFQQSIKWIL